MQIPASSLFDSFRTLHSNLEELRKSLNLPPIDFPRLVAAEARLPRATSEEVQTKKAMKQMALGLRFPRRNPVVSEEALTAFSEKINNPTQPTHP